MRAQLSSLVICAASLLVCGPAQADGEGPLGAVLQDARASGALERAGGTAYYEGGARGRTLVVQHTLRVSKQGIESVFLEHFKSGDSLRTSYRMDFSGRLLQVVAAKTTAKSHPKPISVKKFKVKDGELVLEGKDKGVALPENAAAMPLMMFVLPALFEHLPESIELTPVFGNKVLGANFTLRRGTAKNEEIAVQLMAPDGGLITKVVVSVSKATRGKILRIVAGDGEKILPLSAKEAQRQLAELRSKKGAEGASSAGFATPRAAVESFVAACAAGDLKAVGACFSAKAPGEFKTLRDGSVPPGDFKQLCDLFEGAVIGEAKIRGERAKVPVALKSRKESLSLVKEAQGWRILDF
ncbi:MAG: hypothetical protein JKY65_20255 [Planctomycetes bacterium]|nr:hypothetical protein [Planctomycetota bacterium]